MKKKIAFFDIDGVVYNGHCVLEQIKSQENKGILTRGTFKKIWYEGIKYKLHLQKYEKTANQMLKIHAEVLKNKNCDYIKNDTYLYLVGNYNNFFTYFKELIPVIQKTHDICLVSNNFQFACEAVCKIFKITKYISSIAKVKNRLFTGDVQLSLVGNKKKVSKLINKYGKAGSIAVGNSLNDFPMLDLVDYAFVFEPNFKTKVISKQKSWNIINRNTAFQNILSTINNNLLKLQ